MDLILASSSTYRRDMLRRLMVPFTIVAPHIDETPLQGESPAKLVARLATEKAGAVAEHHPEKVVIGADQVAVHGDEIVGKPGDFSTAFKQLRSASGTCVELINGICVISPLGGCETITESYRAHFRVLDDQEISHYLETERPYDCAGAVKIEGLGIALLARLDGDDPTAIIGLPLIQLCRLLKHAGINVLAPR